MTTTPAASMVIPIFSITSLKTISLLADPVRACKPTLAQSIGREPGIKRRPAASRKACHQLARESPQEGLARIHLGVVAADRFGQSDLLVKMPLRRRSQDRSLVLVRDVLPCG